MKKCLVCNNEIDDDCVFCPNCGTKIEKDRNSEEREYFEKESDSDLQLQSPFGMQSPFGVQSPFGMDSFSEEENLYGTEDFYENPYNQRNPYDQGDPYSQGDPYNQKNPYSQRDTYGNKNSYTQENSDQKSPHSLSDSKDYLKQKKRSGIFIPVLICISAAVVVCGVLLVTKGGLFSGNSVNEQKMTGESSTGNVDADAGVVPVSEPKPVQDLAENVEATTPAPVSYAASDIIVSLVNKDSVDMSRLKDASILSADSSSVISQKNTDNSANCLFDNNIQTNWQEGVEGPGIGQSVTAYFNGSEKVRCILFKLGNWKTEEYFYGNNRPSRLGITIGDLSTEVEFPESWEEFCIELNHPYEASSVTFTINDVYKGTSWDDTVITDIHILCDRE